MNGEHLSIEKMEKWNPISFFWGFARVFGSFYRRLDLLASLKFFLFVCCLERRRFSVYNP